MRRYKWMEGKEGNMKRYIVYQPKEIKRKKKLENSSKIHVIKEGIFDDMNGTMHV
jgi:hypothetical protein